MDVEGGMRGCVCLCVFFFFFGRETGKREIPYDSFFLNKKNPHLSQSLSYNRYYYYHRLTFFTSSACATAALSRTTRTNSEATSARSKTS